MRIIAIQLINSIVLIPRILRMLFPLQELEFALRPIFPNFAVI